MTTRATICRLVATAIAIAAVALFAIAPLLLAGHDHESNPASSHCAVCVLATIAVVATGGVPDASPPPAELGVITSHGPEARSADQDRIDASRAPPLA